MKNTKTKTKTVAKSTKAKTKKTNTRTNCTWSYTTYERLDFRARLFLFKWYVKKAVKALFQGTVVL